MLCGFVLDPSDSGHHCLTRGLQWAEFTKHRPDAEPLAEDKARSALLLSPPPRPPLCLTKPTHPCVVLVQRGLAPLLRAVWLLYNMSLQSN